MLSVLVHPQPSLSPHRNTKALLQRQLGAARGQGSTPPTWHKALHSHRGLCGEVDACSIWLQVDINWPILGGGSQLSSRHQVPRDGQPQVESQQ